MRRRTSAATTVAAARTVSFADRGDKTEAHPVCFMTPTHLGAIPQFSVLRRSIQLFAPSIPHVAIINTEDCARFADHFQGDRHLQIVRTADVLPGDIEQRRRKSGARRFPGGWWQQRHIRGPHARQLTKLFALADSPYEAAAFIDSEIFICRPLGPGYFHVDSHLKLFRRRAADAECLDFDISTHEILGNPLHQVTELYDYIFAPACFRKSTAIRLLARLERGKRSRWMRRFLAQQRTSEYNLLGYAAMALEGGAGYHLVECSPDDLRHWLRFPEDREQLSAEIERMRGQARDFASIQPSPRLHPDLIAEAFSQVEQAYKRAAASCRGLGAL